MPEYASTGALNWALRSHGITLNTQITVQPTGASRKEQAMAGSDQEITGLATEDAPAGVLVREGVYGEKIGAIEPGGAQFIPPPERPGKPLPPFWTRASPTPE